jgi:hypothetical protein
MANIKISELTVLTPPAAADELAVVDVSATSTKKTTVGEIVGIIHGDVDVASNGTATISELPVSKLQDGAARQLLQTDAAGTGVEWTSNVDVPGTLDVTGATALDSTLGVSGQSTLASAAVSDLTSGRVVLAGTSGELEDNAGLAFDGTQLDVDGDVVITGNLTVEGASTILETETVKVEDKNIELGVVASPTDVTADGGGITLKGTTDKTINWVDATDAWTFSEHVNIASAKEYRIAGAKVLDATSLGSAVVSSSLTSVGTIGTGVWEGTAIDKTYLDATLVSTGDTGTVTSTMILDGTIVDADINASAAIAGTKIDPDFGSQTVKTTGIFSAAGGSAAAPSIAFTGDTNTGIYSPGADQVAVATNGVGRLFVDASGNVGIGTSASGAALDVRATSFTPTNTGSALLLEERTTNSQALHFYLSNAGVNFSSRPSGGIGAVNSDKLRIAGGGIITDNYSAGVTNFTPSATEAGAISVGGAIQFFTKASLTAGVGTDMASSERLRIDSSGRLLIGASADSGGALLQVNGDRIRVATAKTPASAADTGTAGEVCWDADYIYVCTATNTWKRTAISTW